MTVVTVVGSAATRIAGWGTALFSNRTLLYAVGIGAAIYGGRLWLNAHDDKVFKQGREQAVATMEKDYEARLAQGLEVAAAQREQALADRKVVEGRLDQITALFDQAFARLTSIRAAVEERKVVYVEKVAAVPSSDLDPALRAVSNDIAKQTP